MSFLSYEIQESMSKSIPERHLAMTGKQTLGKLS